MNINEFMDKLNKGLSNLQTPEGRMSLAQAAGQKPHIIQADYKFNKGVEEDARASTAAEAQQKALGQMAQADFTQGFNPDVMRSLIAAGMPDKAMDYFKASQEAEQQKMIQEAVMGGDPNAMAKVGAITGNPAMVTAAGQMRPNMQWNTDMQQYVDMNAVGGGAMPSQTPSPIPSSQPMPVDIIDGGSVNPDTMPPLKNPLAGIDTTGMNAKQIGELAAKNAEKLLSTDLDVKKDLDKKSRDAVNTIDLAKRAIELLPAASNGGMEALTTTAQGYFGKSTPEAETDAELNVIAAGITSNVPRFEGPQGVMDVELYKQAAANVGNTYLPQKVRQAAARQVIKLQEKYAKPALTYSGMSDAELIQKYNAAKGK